MPAGDALRRADELVAAVAEHDGPPATRRLYRAGDPTKRFGAGCDAKDATDANTLAPGSPEAAAAAEDGALCVWATWETQGEDVMVSLGRALAYPMGPAPGDGAAKCAPGAKCVPAAAASPPERTYGLTVSRRTTDPRVLARYQAGKDAGIEAVSREMDALIEKMESLDEGAQENAD
ncbi:MAG: hypothetical protein KC635_01345 [Myxococcales bacterium]|nr:hypothetical protein [Myxococcales bacterium]MCB9737193.1 hypothetical protein [Deltaproteobacteria bacterium]